jgi:hypothetical protein
VSSDQAFLAGGHEFLMLRGGQLCPVNNLLRLSNQFLGLLYLLLSVGHSRRVVRIFLIDTRNLKFISSPGSFGGSYPNAAGHGAR